MRNNLTMKRTRPECYCKFNQRRRGYESDHELCPINLATTASERQRNVSNFLVVEGSLQTLRSFIAGNRFPFWMKKNMTMQTWIWLSIFFLFCSTLLSWVCSRQTKSLITYWLIMTHLSYCRCHKLCVLHCTHNLSGSFERFSCLRWFENKHLTARMWSGLENFFEKIKHEKNRK